MDFSRILNKPYFVRNILWSATSTANTVISSITMPSNILNNALAALPFRASALYRAKMTLILQVAGTPMHQGIVLVASQPAGTYTRTLQEQVVTAVNNYMCSPHVFLAANEASSVALELPFYVNGKLQKTDLDFTTTTPFNFGVDYVETNFMILNPLVAPTSGTNTVTISVHVMFTDMEFYVPHSDVEFVGQGLAEDLSAVSTKAIDGVFSVGRKFTGDLFDLARRGVRSLTGLHNPNFSFLNNKNYVVSRNHPNIVDKPTFQEKMDPFSNFDRITRDYNFDTDVDEMSLRHLFAKPQYISTFVVNTTDVAGTLCWSRPITPAQQAIPFTYVSTDGSIINTAGFQNIHQVLYNLSRFWRGTIKIHVQSSMTNFHFCKLALVRDYSPRLQTLTGTPLFTEIPNLMTETVEFSSGNQVQTFELPFCSPMEQLPCSRDWDLNALMHGMYYIYLMQPLVANGTVPLSVQFNVYFSLGDDFDFFGYAVDPLRSVYTGTLFQTPADDPVEFEGQSAANPVVSTQEQILNSAEYPNENEHSLHDLRPIVSLRDYMRRFYRVSTLKVSGASLDTDDGIRVYDVAQLLGLRNTLALSNATRSTSNVSTLSILQSMFLGYTGGARVKLVLTGIPLVSAWYVPPAFSSYTQPLPAIGSPLSVWTAPSPYDSTSTATANFKARQRQQYEFVKNANPENISQYFSTQTVLAERPNYKVAQGSLLIRQTGDVGPLQDMSFSNCEIEFEIPNNSPFRYLGDAARLHTTNLASVAQSTTTNLGHIVVEYLRPQFRLGDSNLIDTSLQIDVYAACDDVARYGFQTYCPFLVYPGALDGGTFAFQLAGYMNPLNTIPISGVTPSTIVPHAVPYTTKTT